MWYRNRASLGIGLIFSLLCACSVDQQECQSMLLPDTDSMGRWLLSEKIEDFNARTGQADAFQPTGLSADDYLRVIEGQVRAFLPFQDTGGRIIDPVENAEMYYTTPCYAHSVAILASSGYTRDPELIESGMRALDNTCGHMRRQVAPGNHGDFYTYPAMLAYRHFRSFADSARYRDWEEAIRGIDPSRFYAFYDKYFINWNLVHASGEYLRHRGGFVDIHYVDSCLEKQQDHFTDYGLYNEHGNPLAYDLFSRHYLGGVLALGYDGEHLEAYKEILWKGAWMSLFMQSPTGELPTGYRSAQHIWNEAEQAVVFEIMAQQYACGGDQVKAGVFKRAAMLSLASIKDWIRPDGSGFIVKNRFPIEAKQGYERYSVHSCYNLLATSMLAQAWEFAADVEEQACPADVGGYVLPVLDPFHKVFASLNGTYLEYDTRGGQVYNPTGIIRVHLKGTNPLLGPSDGIASMWNGEGTSFALGPAWQNADGSWTSLAEQKVDPVEVVILEESEQEVSFRVTYALPDSVFVFETISIRDKVVHVKDSIAGPGGLKQLPWKKRLTWPLLVFDGRDSTRIDSGKDHLSVQLEGDGVRLDLQEGFGGSIHISDSSYHHRNGIARLGVVEFEAGVISYFLSGI